MLTRAEINRVLLRHGLGAAFRHGDLKPFDDMTPLLVDDLFTLFEQSYLSLSSQPSREELDHIWEIHDHKYGSAEKWREAIKQAIMDWATGKKSWCEHIVWDSGIQQWAFRSYQGGEQQIFIINSSWTCCPICGKRRPE